jgi:MFS family permease
MIIMVLISLSVFISSFITVFWLFALIYGVVFGFCMGLVYMVPIYNAYEFYPLKKGLVSGIIICGFGFGSFTFNWIAYFLMNPNNVKPYKDPVTHESFIDDSVTKHLPVALRSLAAIYLIVGIFGSLLVRTSKSLEKFNIH